MTPKNSEVDRRIALPLRVQGGGRPPFTATLITARSLVHRTRRRRGQVGASDRSSRGTFSGRLAVYDLGERWPFPPGPSLVCSATSRGGRSSVTGGASISSQRAMRRKEQS